MFLIVSCSTDKKTDESTAAQEALTQVEPSTIFENEYAEVVKVVLNPGEEQGIHEGKQRLIYSLSDYSIEWTESGEDEGTKTWNAGDVHMHEAGEHAARNTSNSTAEWLVFVRKTDDLPECGSNAIDYDVHSVSEDHAEILFENELFKLTKVTLPPNGEIPMHSGINRVIYSLSDYTIRYQAEAEPMTQRSFKDGDVHWHEACMHALENIGDTDAEYLVVTYK
jgi:hypothetical protein